MEEPPTCAISWRERILSHPYWSYLNGSTLGRTTPPWASDTVTQFHGNECKHSCRHSFCLSSRRDRLAFFMHPVNKLKPPEESKSEEQEEEKNGENMEVGQNAQPLPLARAAGSSNAPRSRRSSPERFNPHDVFPSNIFADQQDLSMPPPSHYDFSPWAGHHPTERRPSFNSSIDQLFPPAAQGPFNTLAYDHQHPHGTNLSTFSSFDFGHDEYGPSMPIYPNYYGYPPNQYPFPPPNNETPNNSQGAAQESMDDRKPAAVDTSCQQFFPEQGPRSYPTQDRNPSVKAPPYASAHGNKPPLEFEHQNDILKRRSTRSKRNSRASPECSVPPQGKSQSFLSTSRRSGRNKGPAKKGSGTRAKPPRQYQGEAIAPIRLEPTAQELEEARTPRKKDALYTWFQRLGELLEFKRRKGHTNVPQQYPENHSLGIWVNKQRMEKKDMDAGEKSSMTPEKIRLLEMAGFQWAKRKGIQAWEDKFRELQLYQQRHGHCNVPTKNKQNRALGRWVSTQRSNYKKFKLGKGTLRPNTEEAETLRRIRCLEGIGFQWSLLTRDSSSNEEGESEETEEDEEEQEDLLGGDPLFDHPPFEPSGDEGAGGGGNHPFPPPGMGGVNAEAAV